jgi:hypothetical protein
MTGRADGSLAVTLGIACYIETINVPASAPVPCVIESEARLPMLNPFSVTSSLRPGVVVLVACSVSAGLDADP